MNKEEKQKIALVLISLLLIIKFILMPQIEKQAVLVEKISQLQQVNSKYQYVLAKKEELTGFKEKLNNAELTLSKYVPVFTSESDFLLKTQQQLETVFSEFNLKVKRFMWIKDANNVIANVLHHKKISIALEGKTKRFLELNAWLAKNNPQFKIESFLMHNRNNKKDSTSMGTFKGSIIITTFYNEGKTR